jgi:hypothetical protein
MRRARQRDLTNYRLGMPQAAGALDGEAASPSARQSALERLGRMRQRLARRRSMSR